MSGPKVAFGQLPVKWEEREWGISRKRLPRNTCQFFSSFFSFLLVNNHIRVSPGLPVIYSNCVLIVIVFK